MKFFHSRRALFFHAALFLVFCIGYLDKYFEGVKTGVLRFGGRNPKVIVLLHDPERFNSWLNFTVVAALFFGCLAMIGLWAAFRTKPEPKAGKGPTP